MLMNSLSVTEKNVDVNKQMAQMRNYINQLKDEIENDLMNIGYNNLDADLRRRFDDLQTGLLSANNTSLEVAGMLKTQYLKAEEIVATYATLGSLNAVSARIGSLEAIAITTVNLSAQTIYGSQITGLTINANQITAGKIKANQLDSDDIAANAFTGEILYTTRLNAASIYGSCPDVLGEVEFTPRWQYDSSLNRYVMVSAETGRLG